MLYESGKWEKSLIGDKVSSLVNVRDLGTECENILYERLLFSTLMYACEIMVKKEEKRSRIRAVQKDDLRGLLGIRKIDRKVMHRLRKCVG